MIRRFNYTGRRKIPRRRVCVRIRAEGERRSFDAELDLAGMDLPGDARLLVEAYHRAAYQRFDFGTVDDPQPPAERWLDAIPVEKPLFRLKVVRREHGLARILAAADKVVPVEMDRDEAARQSLLLVEFEPLGEVVWSLHLDDEWPRLRLNRDLEGIREMARSSPAFRALVHPEVLRAVLVRALDEGCFDPDSDDEDWGTLWLRFGTQLLGGRKPPQERSEHDDWVEAAVQAFCVRQRVREAFTRLAGAEEEGA